MRAVKSYGIGVFAFLLECVIDLSPVLFVPSLVSFIDVKDPHKSHIRSDITGKLMRRRLEPPDFFTAHLSLSLDRCPEARQE